MPKEICDYIVSACLPSALILAVLAIVPCLLYKKQVQNRHLFVLLYVMMLIWSFRFWVSWFNPLDGSEALTGLEKLFDSLIHTLQTFSMDEDYTGYTQYGKAYLSGLNRDDLASIYGIVISILNVCAPVLGGAMLFDILTGFFPHMRLFLMPRRHKFVFSELNCESITLAEDIFKDKKYRDLVTPTKAVRIEKKCAWLLARVRSISQTLDKHERLARLNRSTNPEEESRLITWARNLFKNESFLKLMKLTTLERKPLFLFADVYSDNESESRSELHNRAKAIGAICVKTDLIHLSLKRSKSVSYFLIDADAHANISALSQLLEPTTPEKLLWPMNRKGTEPITRIFVFGQDDTGITLTKQVRMDHGIWSDKVLVRPIPDLLNTAFNLLYEVPLFLPLRYKPTADAKDLFVTVLGSGPLAEEIFRSVYWCGQMPDIRLHLNVLSKDASQMEQRIKDRYPELLESCKPNAALLKVLPHGACTFNPPYCASCRFLDVDNMELVSSYPNIVLKKTDYFIVALETDELNLQIADQLKVLLTRRAMENNSPCHPVIAPAVTDQRLASAAQNLKPNDYDPYFVPFASLQSRFSCKHVFLSSFTDKSFNVKSLYNEKHQKGDQDDAYKTISSTARAVHAPYKLFGFGLIQEVDLEKDATQRYRLSAPIQLTKTQEDQFAWIEHRRWNAFLRSQGFICPTQKQFDRFFNLWHQTKCIPLKLHPCLVESRPDRVPLPEQADFDRAQYDCLDYVTMHAYLLRSQHQSKPLTPEGLRHADYKKWDYLEHDGPVTDLIPKES